MNIEQKLRLIAGALDRALPFGHSVELNVRRYAHPQDMVIQIHGVPSYHDAQEIFRALGIGDRSKSTWNDPHPRTVLMGKLSATIGVTVFCDGLPPSCRLETFKERVPKKQVTESDTGEFAEIERTRVVCGHGQEAAA